MIKPPGVTEYALSDNLPQKYADFKNEIAIILGEEDWELFGENADSVVSEKLTYLAPLSSEGAINFEAVSAACADDLSDQQKVRLWNIAVEARFLVMKPQKVYYRVPAPFLPTDISKQISEDDVRIFGLNPSEIIIERLHRIKSITSNSETYNFSTIVNTLGDDLSEVQLKRLVEIASKVGILFKKSEGGYHQIPHFVSQAFRRYLNEL